MRPGVKGFTLIELLVAIGVMAVMTGLAVPMYTAQVERARVNEAITNLRIVHAAEKIFRLNQGTYWVPPSPTPTVAQINAALNIDINPQDYPITNVTGSANAYSMVASRGGNTVTMTQTGNFACVPTSICN